MSYQPRHRAERERRRIAPRLGTTVLPLASLAVVAVTGTGFSSAAFTSTSSNATSTVTAAADWTPPTVSIAAPAAFVRGDVTLTATAADADSGVRDVVISYRAAGGSTWSTLCTDTAAPYTCVWATANLASGTYELRAVATDRADNTTTSAITTVVVDSVAPTVTMTDPGTPLSGSRTLTATASDAHSGVAQVLIQASLGSSGTWETLCTTTAAPYSCVYDTNRLANGTYTFRAVATDRAGNSTTSASVTNRVVDNGVLAGADVQTINGGNAGRPDEGDAIVYTFTKAVNLASIASGWDGSARSVTVELTRPLLGSTSSLRVADANLGTINLGTSYNGLLANMIEYSATMTATTTTTNGVARTVVTVRLVSRTQGGQPTGGSAATMVWSPSGLVTDLAGRASATATVSETGALDVDF